MNVFLYIIIFIMGTLFGSFYTLAVYRIPRKLDITHTHSFCPNCGHRLGFFELIPVWSYIFLGGKCKSCKERIRPRYFIFEILSGLTFVLIAYCMKINVYALDLHLLIKFTFIALYLVTVFLIAGIDKENFKIEKSVLYYGLVISSVYIIYLCIMGETSIYRYVMYLITLIILLIIDCVKQLKTAKTSYIIEILMLITIMLINTGELTTLLSVVVVLLAVLIVKIYYKIKQSLNKLKKEHIDMTNLYKFGYLLSTANVIIFIGVLYFMYH